jgi:hypothetical protein
MSSKEKCWNLRLRCLCFCSASDEGFEVFLSIDERIVSLSLQAIAKKQIRSKASHFDRLGTTRLIRKTTGGQSVSDVHATL